MFSHERTYRVATRGQYQLEHMVFNGPHNTTVRIEHRPHLPSTHYRTRQRLDQWPWRPPVGPQTTIREVEEAVYVVENNFHESGELRSQSVAGYSIRIRVPRTDHCELEPQGTDEAAPFWFSVDGIPYTEM